MVKQAVVGLGEGRGRVEDRALCGTGVMAEPSGACLPWVVVPTGRAGCVKQGTLTVYDHDLRNRKKLDSG